MVTTPLPLLVKLAAVTGVPPLLYVTEYTVLLARPLKAMLPSPPTQVGLVGVLALTVGVTGLVKVIEPLAGYAADAQPGPIVSTKLL